MTDGIKVNEIISEEQWEVTISDERGTRKEMRSRFVVANPGVNPVRTVLSEVIIARRYSGKDGLSRGSMAACVAYADEFAKYASPTLDHRKSFAAQLKANRLSPEEADKVAGMAEHLAKYAA